jgi:hypothetical protein
MILAKHKQATDALGIPIQLGDVDLSDRRNNYIDKFDSKVCACFV